MIIEHLEPMVKYNMKVVPFNEVGDGPDSKVVSVETSPSKQLLLYNFN